MAADELKRAKIKKEGYRPFMLIVEPDERIRKDLESFFDWKAYEVFACSTAQDALNMINKQVPAIILTEINLPDRSEFDFLRELRQNTRTSHVPIIVLSRRDKGEDKIRALELGADDFVTKPFAIEELHLRVKNSIMAIIRDEWPSVTGLPTGGNI